MSFLHRYRGGRVLARAVPMYTAVPSKSSTFHFISPQMSSCFLVLDIQVVFPCLISKRCSGREKYGRSASDGLAIHLLLK